MRLVVRDGRVCEKLYRIVERVCMTRHKLPHTPRQFIFITERNFSLETGFIHLDLRVLPAQIFQAARMNERKTDITS